MLLALVLAAAAAIAGCGASDTVDPAAVADAAGATAAAGGAQMSITGTVRSASLPHPVGYTASGTTDSTGKKADLVMNMPNVRLEMVMELPVIYIRLPGLEKQVGKPWVKENLLKVASSSGINVPGLPQGNDNPRQYVDYLRSIKSGVKRVGRETIRGAKTTHYKATVDLRHYPDRLPAAQRPQARAGIQRLIQLTGTATYPVEVWLDSEHRVRRMKMSFSEKPRGQRLTIDQTVDMYDFGLKPRIQPPPGDQVKDLTALVAKRLQQQQP